MAEAKRFEYEVTWESKPLGFSIIMDTEGKNAYVSSIQNETNKKKGVKLASQIIQVNGDNVEGERHQDILHKIIKATSPIKLKFRSMTDKSEDKPPASFSFTNAPDSIAHRVNKYFTLASNKINDRCVWEQVEKDGDGNTVKVCIWYWPASKHKLEGTSNNLWVISREEHIEKKLLYAAAQDDDKASLIYPTMITKPWRIFADGKFEDCTLVVEQAEAGAN